MTGGNTGQSIIGGEKAAKAERVTLKGISRSPITKDVINLIRGYARQLT